MLACLVVNGILAKKKKNIPKENHFLLHTYKCIHFHQFSWYTYITDIDRDLAIRTRCPWKINKLDMTPPPNFSYLSLIAANK